MKNRTLLIMAVVAMFVIAGCGTPTSEPVVKTVDNSTHSPEHNGITLEFSFQADSDPVNSGEQPMVWVKASKFDATDPAWNTPRFKVKGKSINLDFTYRGTPIELPELVGVFDNLHDYDLVVEINSEDYYVQNIKSEEGIIRIEFESWANAPG